MSGKPSSGPVSKNARKILVCNCERTMEIDSKVLDETLALAGPLHVHTHLCRTEIAAFEAALRSEQPLLVACTQEAPLFREVAEESSGHEPADLCFVNIRERAGWTNARRGASAKIAALLADALVETKPARLLPVRSNGVCLVYGAGQATIDVARQLAARLDVSVVLTDAGATMPPATADVPLYSGRIAKATGSLGAFEITVNGYAPMVASSRDRLEFMLARDGARAQCDLIFDMSGATPLFPAGARRDGYFSVDPEHPAAIAQAMFEISDMVGEFEKPIYVEYDPEICAHSRSGKIGCRNCLDNCPTGAISPDGDTVTIDAAVCGGCGNCSAVCPSGAVSYSYPRRADIAHRLQVLAGTFLRAGGQKPIVLFHDDRHGAPIISALARYGNGLAPNVIPLSLHAVTALGHETLLCAYASGFAGIAVLAPPDRTEELPALEREYSLAQAMLEGLSLDCTLELIVEADPDAVAERLAALLPRRAYAAHTFLAGHGKRELARTALSLLREQSDAAPEEMALPAGSPYGRIRIDTQGCTLCLACVGCCPANALADNPDRPQVAFTEAACVQCGLCAATCPENVIQLEPRFSFGQTALRPDILNEEEPFDCISCGKPFGVKSSVERIIAQLEGKHSMFASSQQASLIRMCNDCRVTAMAEFSSDPFKGADKPRVRTTEDYLDAEAKAKSSGRKPEDFLN